MKNTFLALVCAIALTACGPTQQKTTDDGPILANIDLVNITKDQVNVFVDPGKFTSDTTIFYIPKTVPGTYEVNDYGQFVEDLKAYDYDGNQLSVTRTDKNSWVIPNAKQLDKVSYLVNDSFDIEGENGVFSPAGTNIDAGENFMLNLHAFVGYFKGMKEQSYKLVIQHPKNLIATSSLTELPTQETTTTFATDVFSVPRYFQVTDHPIMYAEPDTTSFNLQGMEVLLSVYSPNDVYSAQDLRPTIEKMVVAQKKFLGDLNNTDKYAILLYLSDMGKQDASGFGALEHHTSTTVVLPEAMPLDKLKETMTDVVSHEFFHTLTPLSVHSEEIQYFDYNDPKMSKHLWMYEGVTEYFANLFQVNQGLITPQDFYDRMMEKIQTSRNFDDTMPITELSEHVLEEGYHDSYYNVYQKGALIGMALDIRLRELSNGEMGILDLMKKLSAKYGVNKPFEDDKLFDEIVAMSYPEIGTFLTTYVSGPTPIPYHEFFAKVGLEKSSKEVQTGYLIDMKTQMPYINVNQETGEIYFMANADDNSFLKNLGIKENDTLVSVNGTEYSLTNVRPLIMTSMAWQPGDEVTFVVKRDGKEISLSGKVITPMTTVSSWHEMNLPETDPRVQLRNAWLKG
ncbi:MAG TPA: peptidase M61 [Flavobacteriaceae bacterium]|nr:peptidase M61 [Flavobacteriaceae bacterium]